MKRRLLAFALAFTMAFSTLVTVNAEDISNSVQDEIADDSQDDSEIVDENIADDENSNDSDDASQDEVSDDNGDASQNESSDDSDDAQQENSESTDDEQQKGSADSSIDESQEETSQSEASSDSETETSTVSSEESANSDSDINLDSEISAWQNGQLGGKLDFKQNSPNSVTISGDGKKSGKWSNGTDQFTYYAPAEGIDITKDFVLSATMNIDSLVTKASSNQAQTSAGMLIMGKLEQTPPSISVSIAMEDNSNGYMASNTRGAFDDEGNYKVQGRVDANKGNNTYIRLSDNFAKGENVGSFDLKIEKIGYKYYVSCGDQTTEYDFAKENFMGENGTNNLLYPALFAARDVNVTFSNIKLEVEDRVPDHLEIVSEATDNTALVGNQPELPGLEVAVKYTDGSSKDVTKDYTLKGYNKDSIGKQTAKITVGELTYDYEVEILKKTATKIKIESFPMKNYYYEGQYLRTDNLVVKADYNDGSKDVILKRNEYDVIIQGKVIETDENGKEKDFITADLSGDNIDFVIRRKETEEIGSGSATDSFKGSVSPLKLEELALGSEPVKSNYYIGDTFDSRGMLILGSYKTSNGKKVTADFQESEFDIAFRTKNDDGSLSAPSQELDTTVEGTRVVEITSKFNPSLTVSFEIPVITRIFSEAYISSYPRTTYPRLTDVSNYDPKEWFDYYNGKPDGTTGTEDDETKQYNRGNLEITYLYSNGAEEIVPEDKDEEGKVTYKVDLSNFDITNPDKSPNQIRIYFPEGSLAYGTSDIIIPITIKDDYAKNYWKPVILGASTSPTQSITPGSDEEAALKNGADDNKMGMIYKNKDGEETHFDLRLGKGTSESTAGTFNSYTGGNLQEEGSSLRIWAKGGAGKLADSNDGMSYYYTRLSTKDGFKLSADIKVNSYINGDTDENRDGQEAFGIMARDIVSLLPDEEHTVTAKDSKGKDYVRFVYKPEEAIKDANGEPEPYSISTYNYANMVLLGGYSGSGWPNDKEANTYLFNTTKNRVNLIYRTFIENDPYDASPEVYRSDVQKVLSSSKLPPLKNDGEYDYSEAEGFPKPGSRYHLVLERIKGGYKGTCYDYQSKEFKTDYVSYDQQTDERDVDVLDPDNLYLGFFASRYADIEVSNVNLLKTDLDTSMEPIVKDNQKITTPKLYLKSSTYSTTTDYELVIRTSNNSGGKVTIQQDGKIIYSDAIVKKNETYFPVTLKENDSSIFTIMFTPAYMSEENKDYQELSSYDTVYYTYKISHNGAFDTSKKFIYASPEAEKDSNGNYVRTDFAQGIPEATGDITDPLTFDVAFGLMEKGQSLILLPGVYYRNEKTEINSANGGLKDKRKAVIGYNKYQAKEEGYEVSGVDVPDGEVIFDLNKKNNGFVNHASYWTFKNFHIRNGGTNCKPFHSGGNNCVIENLKIYDSKDSGLCISRTSSDQVSIYDWPSNNIIKNCEVWNCADNSFNNSDGFAVKLTVGYGNKLIGCVSHHNSDDGWDLFCKQSGGLRAPITLEKCITYRGGYELTKEGKDVLYSVDRGGKNGFKMGGDNMPVNDVLIDCIAFENGNSGVTSNSNPKMTIDGCVGYKNKGSNFSLYSSAMEDVFDENGNKIDTVSMCDYKIRGVVSYKPGAADGIAGYNYDKQYNYFKYSYDTGKVNQKGEAIFETVPESVNSAGAEVTDDFFVSLTSPVVNGHIPQDPKTGDFLTNGFLELKESVKNQIKNSPGYEEDFVTTAAETEESTENRRPSAAITGIGGGSSKRGNSSSSSGSSSSNNNSNNNSTGDTSNTNTDNKDNSNNSSANTEGNKTEGSKIESSKPQINEKTVDVEADNGAKVSVPESIKDKVTVSSSSSFEGNAVSVEFDSSVAPKVKTGWVEIPFNGDISNPDKIIAVITDKDGNEKIIKAAFYDETTGKVLAPAIGSGIYGALLSDVSFDDMDGNWAKPYVEALAARGIINGINDSTFAPNAKIKRGDFVLMLANVIDISSSNDAGFSDVSSSDYYSNAIAAAKENGLVNGISSSEFGAKENISRQDVMAIIARTLEAANIKLTAADISQFNDSDMISDYAKEAISKLVGEGIISGNNGSVNPKDSLSRAEASKILYEVWKRF